ncbi:farnesyltranstransferase [Mycena polygramma]|nr:farnesyltranstransferase [Mycena polygramma]
MPLLDGILSPFTYTASQPGHGMRGRLLSSLNLWINVPEAEMEVITTIVGMLHNASLMLDDIEDGSPLRRGEPAAHVVYGIPLTVNAATYVITLAYRQLSGLKNCGLQYSHLVEMVTGALTSFLPDYKTNFVKEELGHLHDGQGLDIIWRNSVCCPMEAEYVDMVKNKTGGLLRIGVKLMMACATTNVETDYVPLVDLISVYYQIRDDYLNLQSPLYSADKGFAEDLDEGKFSFPIIHGVRTDTSNHLILDALKARQSTSPVKIAVIQYLQHGTKSFDYTLSTLECLEAEIDRKILALGGNAELSAMILALRVDRPAVICTSG